MRHAIAGNKLGRNSAWRMATVRDIAKATLICQRITTTKAKAKEARKLVDQLITLGKKGSLAHKRRAFAILQDHKLVSNLFNKTASRFKNRQGGYTRIIPISNRRGDNAQLALLELTEKEEIIVTKPKTGAGKKAQAAPKAPEAEDAKTAPKTEKTSSRPTPKKVDPKSDKSGKKIVGGIKNMFRRKQTDG